jgi:ubiquinone/menaquinone biosynthesis C-methylase UbiE
MRCREDMNHHREFFTGLSEGWDSMCAYDSAKMSLFIDMLDITPGSLILDVGCGTGVFTRELRARFGSTIRIIGLDISEGMLEKARHKLGSSSNVSFVQGDGANRFSREGSLDRIQPFSYKLPMSEPVPFLQENFGLVPHCAEVFD